MLTVKVIKILRKQDKVFNMTMFQSYYSGKSRSHVLRK